MIESNQFESYFRVNSLFFDPNIYGRFLALVMIAHGGVLLWSAPRRDGRDLAPACSPCCGAALLLTFSQSSFAALLVGLRRARRRALAAASRCSGRSALSPSRRSWSWSPRPAA